jgi:hypothetical protein
MNEITRQNEAKSLSTAGTVELWARRILKDGD